MSNDYYEDTFIAPAIVPMPEVMMARVIDREGEFTNVRIIAMITRGGSLSYYIGITDKGATMNFRPTLVLFYGPHADQR